MFIMYYYYVIKALLIFKVICIMSYLQRLKIRLQFEDKIQLEFKKIP